MHSLMEAFSHTGDVRGGNSSPNHTVITELDDDSRSMRKGSTGKILSSGLFRCKQARFKINWNFTSNKGLIAETDEVN